MLPYNVHKNEQGFTLIEAIVTTVIVGILAAITAPNFWQMYKQFEVNQAFNQLQSALQEAQRQAAKKSQTCTVTVDTSNKRITGSSGCLLETRNLPSSVSIAYSGSSSVDFSFTFRGHTSTGRTIVLYDSNKNNKKCLAIAAGIGIMRTGNY
ncbi:MAG: GspH/FimT family pseudopilin, partial [Brasilonema sp.]